MPEYQSPTLGRVEFPTEYGIYSCRVTTYGNRVRLMSDAMLIDGMREAAHRAGERTEMRAFMADEAQLPIGAPR